MKAETKLLILAAVTGFFFILAVLAFGELDERRDSCREQCDPFVWRASIPMVENCECKNQEGHWVPQNNPKTRGDEAAKEGEEK